MVAEAHWDADKYRVNLKHPNSERLNAYLARKAAEFKDEVLDQEKKHKSLTSRQLRDKIIGKKPTDFFKFADEANRRYLADGKIGTYDKNASIIQKLKEYLKETPIDIQDIDPQFLSKYEKYLKETLKNKINTVHKDLKFLRKLFNDAQRQDLIEYQQNPFNK